MSQPERKERIAIALADLDRVPTELRGPLLKGKLDLSGAVRIGADRAIEETPAVVFHCTLLEAATICDILRSHDRKMGEQATRVYINKEQSWSRVPFDIVLTVIVAGEVKLNPALFPNAVVMGDAPPIRLLKRG